MCNSNLTFGFFKHQCYSVKVISSDANKQQIILPDKSLVENKKNHNNLFPNPSAYIQPLPLKFDKNKRRLIQNTPLANHYKDKFKKKHIRIKGISS